MLPRIAKEFKIDHYQDLRHSDLATMLKYYVDMFPEDLEEVAEMLVQR